MPSARRSLPLSKTPGENATIHNTMLRIPTPARCLAQKRGSANANENQCDDEHQRDGMMSCQALSPRSGVSGGHSGAKRKKTRADSSDARSKVDAVAGPKIYQEPIDIEALRVYTRKGKTTGRLLEEAEKCHAPTGVGITGDIRRLSVKYRTGEYVGRRIADGASLANVSRECRAVASGKLLCEVDITKSYARLIAQMADRCMKGLPRTTRKSIRLSALRYDGTEREAMLNTMAQHYGVTLESARNLCARLHFGGSISSWRKECRIDSSAADPATVLSYQEDAKEALRHIVASRPELAERLKTKSMQVDEGAQATMAYIVGETEDRIVRVCEEVIERHDMRVSTILHGGFMVETKCASEGKLDAVLREAEAQVKSVMGLSVDLERLTWDEVNKDLADVDTNSNAGKEKKKVPKAKARKKKVCAAGNSNAGAAMNWSAAEKKQFSEAMRSPIASNRQFWHTLSSRVGRSVEECKQYHFSRYQLPKERVRRKPVIHGRLPKADGPLRIKRVRQLLKRENSAHSNDLSGCFQGELRRDNSASWLDEIAATPLSGGGSQPLPLSQASLTTPDADTEHDIAEPPNVHKYIHAATQLARSPRAEKFPSLVKTESGLLCDRGEVQELLRKIDYRDHKEAEWDKFYGGSDCGSIKDTQDSNSS